MKTIHAKPDESSFVRLFSLIPTRILALATVLITLLIPPARAEVHPLLPDYANVLVTYACHAKSLWHDTSDGGYWGDGLNAKNQNGAVRGNSNTLLTYAMLIEAMDGGWLRKDDLKTLHHAGLTRDHTLKYIRLNLAYLAAHHQSADTSASPVWGSHWQSSLWMQSIGITTLLRWNDLSDDLKISLRRVAAAEASWVGSRPPHDMQPGNTGAEENAWDTGASAVALAFMPESTSATLWMQTLKTHAVNTYSHPDDKKSSDPVSALVSTTNLNSDWTLFNHKFFHPDYSQVSGMHLGEAWIILSLADKIHGTSFAPEFEPFARHNVSHVWENVLRPLLLPTGEFAYPAGNDWTYHCSTNQGYFAYIATAFNSYDAAEAEIRALEHVKNRREASPPGRILGDSNLEWWWEPLVCKRSITAMLHHILRPGHISRVPGFEATVDGMTSTTLYTDAKVWLHRTPQYFFSISSEHPRVGYFVPLAGRKQTAPYTTIPIKNSLLPHKDWIFQPEDTGLKSVQAGLFRRNDKAIAAVLCMENSIAVLSLDGFSPLGVENDSLTDPGRTVHTETGPLFYPSLKKTKPADLPGNWINIDDTLGMLSIGGFHYKPTGGWNHKSVALDEVQPKATRGVWQLLSATADSTAAISKSFTVSPADSTLEVRLQDGPSGLTYLARLTDRGLHINPLPK